MPLTLTVRPPVKFCISHVLCFIFNLWGTTSFHPSDMGKLDGACSSIMPVVVPAHNDLV